MAILQRLPLRLAGCCLLSTLIGIAGGVAIVHAQTDVPTEHSGLVVEALGVLPEESLKAQLGLAGYVMQLRAITIEPNGVIAKHSHETRPGLAWMIDGAVIEGRDSGETEYAAGGTALLEDANTVHWFWNRSDAPATAIVCDIVPAS